MADVDFERGPYSGFIPNERNLPVAPDWGDLERQLREASARAGVSYDPGGLEGIQRNASYERNAGNPNVVGEYFQNALQNIQQRAAPTGDRRHDSQSAEGNALYGSGSGNTTNTPGGAFDLSQVFSRFPGASGQQWSGNWFDDPATQQLESVIKGQLNRISNPAANDPVARLESFLSQRFGELANSNGYSPDELAILNTQAFEPIESNRKASQQRVLERASQRGILPSSGLVQSEAATVDREADRARTQASRDLSINAINERSNRLNQALQLGQAGVTNQRASDAQLLQLATLLQQLPVQAMNQALAVLNGTTPPESLFGQVSQATGLGMQQQQQNDARQYAMWQSIARALDGLFR